VKRTLAHLSDLHLGRSEADTVGLRRAVTALIEADVDHVVVTGDITDGGQFEQLACFRRLTAPLADRLTVVPGNHDRIGEDAGRLLMRGRVATETRRRTTAGPSTPTACSATMTSRPSTPPSTVPRPACSWRSSSTTTSTGCRGTTSGSAWRSWSACPGPPSCGAVRPSSAGCALAAISSSTVIATCQPSSCWGAERTGRCGS
jgi:hypothetical protein